MTSKGQPTTTHTIKSQNYNSLKNELEQETAFLLQERYNIVNQLENDYQPNQHAYQSSNLHTQSNLQTKPHSQDQRKFVDSLRDKIQEVIGLCEGNEGFDGDLGEIALAEKHILEFLDDFDQQTGKNHENNQEQSRAKNLKIKENKKFNYEPGQLERFRSEIGDEAMEMIEEIERKALEEIESLRRDKIELIQRLNEEIRLNNDEKKLRMSSHHQTKHTQDYRRPNMEVVDEENEDNEYGSSERNPEEKRGSFSNRNSFRNPRFGEKRSVQPNRNNHFNNSKEEIYSEMERLRNENQRIKESIPHMKHDNNHIKAQLREELGQLSNQASRYQNLISQGVHNNHQFNHNELQNLYTQSQQLTNEGNKLLHKRKDQYSYSKPQQHTYESEEYQNYYASSKVNERENNHERPVSGEIRESDYSRPPFQTFSPMDKSYHSYTYKSSFAPMEYENLINQMKNATSG